MAGKGTAVVRGQQLADRVVSLAGKLGLSAREQVKVARRIWGSERKIDVVITEPTSKKRLGVECKFQSTPGTAEEKIPTTIQDIDAWPIPGIVVFDGDGFSPNMRSFLHASGKAVSFEDLEPWLRLFFGLEIE
ncbi:MAG: hypothetical protein PHU25_19150 [Deltaproteobacteria bacterium]|nr:hypothetical protein [Deltaproteobacteria bacterium]